MGACEGLIETLRVQYTNGFVNIYIMYINEEKLTNKMLNSHKK